MSLPARRRVTGPASYDALRPANQDARHRALDALAHMRRGETLTSAATHAGTTPATVRRYASAGLTQQGRRWQVTPTDRIYRRMRVLGVDGLTDVDVRSSRQATRVAQHHNAVDRYLRIGDARGLRRFTNTRIGGVLLMTDLDQLQRQAQIGELAIDDIYPTR